MSSLASLNRWGVHPPKATEAKRRPKENAGDTLEVVSRARRWRNIC